MNERAQELGMNNTSYADSTGMDEKTVTTAMDTAILCEELMEHEELQGYLTTWMVNVRGDETELVSTNRLIRDYKGIFGMKACASDKTGPCLAAAAERDGMKMICVLLDSESQDTRFDEARKLMNYGFGAYELYTPEIPAEALEEIPVKGGTALTAAVEPAGVTCVLIPKGGAEEIDFSYKRVKSLNAPVKRGTVAGEITLKSGDTVILATEIVAAKSVDQMTFGKAFKKALYNLLEL